MPDFAVILLAAGKSSRYGDKNYKKPFAPLGDRAAWLHSADKFLNREDVKQLILVIAAEDEEHFRGKFGANVAILGIDVALGGEERADSVQNGLAKVRPDIEFVAIHDAARPCLADSWIDDVFTAAAKTGAAILAAPITGTLKKSDNKQCIAATVDRSHLWEAQTPQVFSRQILLDAYAARSGSATDDAQLVENLGKPVQLVSCSSQNIKITTRSDLRLAELILKALPKAKSLGPLHPFANDDMWR